MICSSENCFRFIYPSLPRPDSSFNWRKNGHVNRYYETKPMLVSFLKLHLSGFQKSASFDHEESRPRQGMPRPSNRS